jgi:hypothetical protein
MPSIGNTYWPDGLPANSSNPGHDCTYINQDGYVFRICYTDEQIQAQVRKRGFFAPYFPLFVTAPPRLPP